MPHGRRHGKPAGTARRVYDRGSAAGGLWVALVLDRATNIDEVVGKHPSPTQRLMPTSPRYRQRLRPCRRLATLMRPSQPVRHFWPLRNQRFFCSRFAFEVLWADVQAEPNSDFWETGCAAPSLLSFL